MTEPSITCPECGMTSYHPKDIEYGYCGNCHAYTSIEGILRREIGDRRYERLEAILKERVQAGQWLMMTPEELVEASLAQLIEEERHRN